MNATFKKIVQSVWFLRGRFSWLNIPLPCKLPFGSWYLAYGDGMGLMFFFHRPFEKNEWQFVRTFLKPGMTFFDVGANQGFYSLLAAKQVGLTGRVVSFEPVPSQIQKLKKNIAINRFKNVVMESIALGSREGLSDMHVCIDGDEALSSLRRPSEDIVSKKKVIKVSVNTLDHYVATHRIKSIDCVKIDVEGGELEVLKGAVGVIQNLRPIFVCEIQDIRTLPWGYQAVEIYQFLKLYGYFWYKVTSGGRLEPAPEKEEYIVNGENLIAIPKEKITDMHYV